MLTETVHQDIELRTFCPACHNILCAYVGFRPRAIHYDLAMEIATELRNVIVIRIQNRGRARW